MTKAKRDTKQEQESNNEREKKSEKNVAEILIHICKEGCGEGKEVVRLSVNIFNQKNRYYANF